jgi:hypothetical protein
LTPNKQAIIARAQRAAELLEHPAFRECLEELEARFVDQWKSSRPDGYEERERAYGRLQAVWDIRAQVKLFMDEAKLAKR